MIKEPETTEEWKTYMREQLDATQFMVLATGSGESLWVCPVYFAYDDSFTLFFLSKPTSRHMRNIEKQSDVACAIFHAMQNPQEKVRGLQTAGKAHFVGRGEALHAFEIYFAPTHVRTPVSPQGGALNYTNPSAEWRLAKITPERVECFDEYRFSDGKKVIPQEVYTKL